MCAQSFHNEVRPDCFDNTNYNFMFRLMPYYFGAGCCFVTGASHVQDSCRAVSLRCPSLFVSSTPAVRHLLALMPCDGRATHAQLRGLEQWGRPRFQIAHRAVEWHMARQQVRGSA